MQAQKWNNSRIRRLLFAESCALSLSISYRLPFSILQPSFPFCCRHNLNLRRPDDTRETYVHRCHSILPPLPFLSSVSSSLPRGGSLLGSSLNFSSVSNFSHPSLDSSRFLLSPAILTYPRPYCFWPRRGGSHERDRSRDVVI